MANDLITLESVGSILEGLEKAFFDIPFENSDFQTQAFVIAAAQTPARAYRVIGLQIFSKVQALKQYQYDIALAQIDLEEKEAKLQSADVSEYDKRRLQLEIMKAKDGRAWSDKLANDALRSLNVLYAELQKYPAYTREQFEAEEAMHYDAKLNRQLKVNGNGAMEALANMKVDMTELPIRVQSAKQILLAEKAG